VKATQPAMPGPDARRQRRAKGHHFLLDGAEYRQSGGVQHLDAQLIAELQEWRARFAELNPVQGAPLRDA